MRAVPHPRAARRRSSTATGADPGREPLVLQRRADHRAARTTSTGRLTRLAALLDMPPAQIRERLQVRGPRFRSLVVKADATEEDVARVEARRWSSRRRACDVVPLRSYPLAGGAAHGLGTWGRSPTASSRPPRSPASSPARWWARRASSCQYNRELMGKRRPAAHHRQQPRGGGGREAEQRGPPGRAQRHPHHRPRAAGRRCEEAMAGDAGSVVALDPETGEVLAYLSSPAYDPNLFSPRHRARGVGAASSRIPEKPLINRVDPGPVPAGQHLQDRHRPGRAAGGRDHPAHDASPARATSRVYGTFFRCHKDGGPRHAGPEARPSPSRATCTSTSGRPPGDRAARRATRRRWGSAGPSGIDLPHEGPASPRTGMEACARSRPAGIPAETVSVAIGQGHVRSRRAAGARGGGGGQRRASWSQPHLMKRSAARPRSRRPRPVDLGFKPSVVAAVRERDGGGGGRGHRLRAQAGGRGGGGQDRLRAGRDPRPAGARQERPTRSSPTAGSSASRPRTNPRIAMAVLVEHGKSGRTSAAPVAGKILARYFGVPDHRPRP